MAVSVRDMHKVIYFTYMNSTDKNSGFMRIILIVLIAILILSYFKIDLRSAVESPASQSNFSYIKNLAVTTWTNYLEKPAMYLWNYVFIDLLWKSFVSNMTRIKNGQPTDFDMHAPLVTP